MAKVRDTLRYLGRGLPDPADRIIVRLMKLVYLADWRTAWWRGYSLTSCEWVFDRFGPVAAAVYDTLRADPAWIMAPRGRLQIGEADLLAVMPTLTTVDAVWLDRLLADTATWTWTDLVGAVWSTYPIRTGTRGTGLPLASLARYARATGADPGWC